MEEKKKTICQKTNTEISGEECIWKSFGFYLQDNYKRLLRFGCIGSLIAAVCIIAVFCTIPKEKSYRVSAYILLENQGNVSVYPSGKLFSPLDILSSVVLKQVYNELKLEGKMSYETFTSSLSIVQSNTSRDADARYAASLNDKKTDFVEMSQVEEGYKDEKRRFKNAKLTLSMTSNAAWLTQEDASKIMNAVLETWYKVYSQIEARSFPCIDLTDRFQRIRKNANRISYLILLEQTREYSNDLLAFCKLLNEMLQGTNVCLPDGDALGSLMKRINVLQKYKIDVIFQYVLVHPQQTLPFDKIYLRTYLNQIENELLQLLMMERGIENAMNIVSIHPLSAGSGNAGKNNASQDESVSALKKTEFFNSFTRLIYNEENARIRQKYTTEMLENKELYNRQEVEKQYYLKLIGLNENKTVQQKQSAGLLSAKQLNDEIEGIISELAIENGKAVQFRDIILPQYLSSRKFFSISDQISSAKTYAYSPFRAGAGLLLFWVLYFGIYVIIGFTKKNNTDHLDSVRDRAA